MIKSYASLDLSLKLIFNKKSELLMMLERPDIPLHNNLRENGIREYVKKRKITGPTRSLSGNDNKSRGLLTESNYRNSFGDRKLNFI